MTVTIKGTKLSLTDALKAYVDEKIGGLDRYCPGLTTARVELELTTRHHNKGEELFRAEVNIQAPNHLFRAEATTGDLYASIDSVKDELKTEMRRYTEKKKDKELRAERHKRS